ncbi:Werner Syndrome-like exonuclease isoform X2 [Cryptotermes secundus]|uniref:Werner Syndrome-like exonuclease isoform X2 n=1 Tax=Cryptotermes secundus TaxID=105785 RepID=UPI000CD7B1A2|nr:Werner Syndrome-like exonuclease isoform X2 [Cryptotermes secundus]
MAVHDKPSQRKLPAWMTLNAEGENEQFTHDTNENPNLSFMGTVHYCRTEKECGRACESLMKQVETQEELVIGFDMEWPVHFKTGSGKTALIQICAEEQTCYLFHVSCMRSLPEAFVHLLKHPKFKLVGVNIKNDLWKLSRDFGITVKPLIESRVVDLGELANETLRSGQRWSLDRLVLHVIYGNGTREI